MKYFTAVLALSFMACAPMGAEGITVTGLTGASIPDGSDTGVSPSISARGMKVFGSEKLKFGIGLTASQDFNFIRKDKPNADGSTGNGLSQSVYATAKPPTQEQEQNQDQSQEQNVTINYPQAQQMIPPRVLRDLAPNSIFTLAPTASLGYEIENFLPYIVGGAGLSQVTRQDGLSNWGNGYFVGAGFNYELGNDWFVGAEVIRASIDTEVATYRTDKYFASFGKRF